MESVKSNSYPEQSVDIMDDDFYEELIETFILEFEELIEIYSHALKTINSDRQQAIKDLFRVYHTLKGDASFFEQYARFAEFASHYCELLRPQDDSVLNNDQLIHQIRLNLTPLTAAVRAMKMGKSLESFHFDHQMKNF
ncbi:MAG: Hpt domain-containing protein [Candidatus Kariarchaeaceae archaeon]|jgi:chemotaxis protein histidine kinase CheA